MRNLLAKDTLHVYSATGFYTIHLHVTSDNGCVDSITRMVEIYPVPEAAFRATNVCEDEAVTFTNDSKTITDTLANSWDFGDAMNSMDKDPAHNYANHGTYSVQLLVTNRNGCKDSIAKNIEVYPVPVASFNLTEACLETETIFDNQTTSDSDTLSFKWTFGDGSKSTDKNPAKTYTRDGTFRVQLEVETEDGCTSSDVHSVEVHPLPEGRFNHAHQGFGRYVFEPIDKDLSSYAWDFGDGNTSTDISPEHKFASEGEYDVTLVTTDANGCQKEEVVQISVSTGFAEIIAITSDIKVYPNPFTETATISYKLKKDAFVSIELLNLEGKRIEVITNQNQTVGDYQVNFNSSERPGVYIIRMLVDEQVYHHRLFKTE